ncbi:MAG: hypothetical protein ACFB00_10165 [Parvularculaceae bacterium]
MVESAATGPAVAAAEVSTALRRAATRTGVDFGYLYNVAVRESGLDASAKAATSTAAGLFQFVEQTWLETVKTHGAKHGLAAEAEAITVKPNGRYDVADAARRDKILSLRYDGAKAAVLAGELANQNRGALEAKLGRPVSASELYAAHFLGAGGAAKLLTAPGGGRAADLLPAAANANAPVFFDGNRARTVREVIAGFERSIAGTQAGPKLRAPATPQLPQTAALHTEKSNVIVPDVPTRRPAPSESQISEALARSLVAAARAPAADVSVPAPTERERAPRALRDGPFAIVPAHAAPDARTASAAPLAAVVLQSLDPTTLQRERKFRP